MPYLIEAEQYYYHFPDVGNMMQLEEHIRVFREAYRGIRCNVHEDYIIYTVYWGGAETRAKAANELISKLNLPLVAVPSTHKGLANDTFIVKSIHSK